jgi:hypothetical protein
MATYINLGQLTIDCDFCNQQVFTISISDPPLNRIVKPFLVMCNDCKAKLIKPIAQPQVLMGGGF